MTAAPLLDVKNLEQCYTLPRESLFRPPGQVRALNGVSVQVQSGKSLGIVGESGSGKSTFARVVMALERPTGGQVALLGRDLNGISPDELRRARRDFQMVFQDPYGSLDPRQTIARIVAEPLTVLDDADRTTFRVRVAAVLKQVGLRDADMDKYPHEFSGGQRQRIAIARALAVEPKLIICDEPVSALDVSIRSQILNLLRELQDRLGLAYIFVSHDLAVVKHIADRVAVMNLGGIVEEADADELFAQPRHPYSRALLSAIPLPQPHAKRAKVVLQGEIPSALDPPSGCRFHTRCPFVIDRCRTEAPALVTDDAGHATACHRVSELPPADTILPAAAGFSPALAKLVAAFSRKTEGANPAGVGIQSARPTTT